MRGAKVFKSLPFYDPIPHRMATSETLEWWYVASEWLTWDRKTPLNDYRRKHWNYSTAETAFGIRNWDLGWRGPYCGAFANPLSDGVRSLGRGLFWGLIACGPDSIRLAFDDLSFDHAGEGLRCGLAVTILSAAMLQGSSVTESLGLIQPLLGHRAKKLLNELLEMNIGGMDPQDIYQILRVRAQTENAHDAVLNFGIVICGLLLGKGFDPSIRFVAGLGGEAGENTLIVASLLALDSSVSVLSDWFKPLGSDFVAGFGLMGLDIPRSLEDFVSAILRPVAEPAPFTVAPDLEPEPLVGLNLAELVETARALLEAETVHSVDDKITWQVLANWDGKRHDMEGALCYRGPMALEPTLKSSWNIATREPKSKLGEGETFKQGIITRPSTEAGPGAMELRVADQTHMVPLPEPMNLYMCGPLPNVGEEAFLKEYPAEKSLTLGETFMGRSGLGAQWQMMSFPAFWVDLEELFIASPGVICLATRVALPPGESHTLVFSGSPGGVVKLNGQEVIRYNDTHTPSYLAESPYSATFQANAINEIVVRVIRNNQPLAPIAFYILDASGKVVNPTSQLWEKT